ncbi:phosphatase PAP2 family protein [Altererythrobacter arenosus]|uniref:Phosphatase PAP2 family protein n=1 Tax=Altererythrobacter arenosus TaxID=3032592 RepID=A0ABY8FS76_9SPHN|nr:phosphatase PAP2 family protein [Altererythrobacter sp. CAU 1644]WFL77874.1 phosphatase PAP2 family protein [Altererythrobacter sp. CAU 1644]
MLIVSFVALIGVAINRYVASIGGPDIPFYAYLPSLNFYILAIISYICAAASYLLIRYRPTEPTKFLIGSPEATRLWKGIVIGLPPIVALAFYMPSFSLIKSSIPLINDYGWDARFIEWDRALHGDDPWRILQPILGFPIITSILAKLYHAWFLLIYFGSMYFAFLVEDRRLRYRYLFSYFVMWTIGGMAMAVGFASVGPCFLEPVFGSTYFSEQMRYLYAANDIYPVDVLEVQQEILNWYETKNYGLGRGISAMPSMHVALAFLFFLGIRRVSKLAGWFFGIFAFLIQIASVHLGYHYAIDGYVSIVLVGGVWWAMGKAVPYIVAEEGNTSSKAREPGLVPTSEETALA